MYVVDISLSIAYVKYLEVIFEFQQEFNNINPLSWKGYLKIQIKIEQ